MSKNQENDITVLRKLCNGDSAFMKEMIQVFLRTSPQSLEMILAGIKNKDYEQVGNYAHKLKSSIQIVGNDQLHSLVKKMEKSARSGDPSHSLKEAGIELEEALNQLYTFLNSKLNDPNGLV